MEDVERLFLIEDGDEARSDEPICLAGAVLQSGIKPGRRCVMWWCVVVSVSGTSGLQPRLI